MFQVRVCFVKDVQKQEAWWERQHELAAENFGVRISSNISYSSFSSFNFFISLSFNFVYIELLVFTCIFVWLSLE